MKNKVSLIDITIHIIVDAVVWFGDVMNNFRYHSCIHDHLGVNERLLRNESKLLSRMSGAVTCWKLVHILEEYLLRLLERSIQVISR